MIERSDTIEKISAALLKAQKGIIAAHKNKQNHTKGKYADLESVIDSVKPSLNDSEITFLQAIDTDDKGAFIQTVLLHSSGQFLCSKTPVFCNKPNDPQAFGSGVTYSKRYALQAILGLPTTDDDGEAAGNGAKETTAKTDIPAPTKEAKAVIDAVVKKLAEDSGEFVIDHKRVGDCIYALKKGGYVTDIKKAGTIAAYLTKTAGLEKLSFTQDEILEKAIKEEEAEGEKLAAAKK